MACLKALQKLTDSNYRIAAIETADKARILEMFKRFNIETGCAVYEWNNAHGLNRLGFEHIFIPKTKSSREIIKYILGARHFGIYLLFDYNHHLTDKETEELLSKIALKNDGIRRLVVFIGSNIQFTDRLKSMSIKIQHSTPNKRVSVSPAAVING